MLNSLLQTAMKYPSYFSLGALVLSTFFAGSMLKGDRVRTQEIKAELREIQAQTEQSLAAVEQIQVNLEQEDAKLVSEISQAYEVIATLNEQARVVRAEIERSEVRNRQLQANRNRSRQQINDSRRFFNN